MKSMVALSTRIPTLLLVLLSASETLSAKPKREAPPEPPNYEEPAPRYSSRSQVARNQALFKKVGVSGFYNLTDSASFEASVGGQSVSGSIKTTSSYGIGADLNLKTLENGITIKALGGYEFSRTFNSMSWRAGEQSGSQTLETPKPALTMWLVGLQGEMIISDGINLIGGGNFNFPTIKNSPGSYSGKFGWHAGASMLISDNLYIDAIWRSLNISGSQDKLTFDNINFSGLLFRGRMTFE
jgi:hypothetical protein